MSVYNKIKKLFSYTTLISLVKDKRKSILKNFQDENNLITNKELYEKNYRKLFEEHKYEYIFKNEFLNVHLKDILNNNSKLLYEINLFENNNLVNILDLLYVTKTTAYAIEIKGDFDTTIRLEHQIKTYCRLFKYVYLFISENKLEEYKLYLEEMDMNTVGIIVLKPNKIEIIKKPLLNNVDIDLIKENIKINFKKLISNITNPDSIYSIWIELLKNQSFDMNFVANMPRCLAFFAYSHSAIKKLRKARLINFFKN